MMELLSRSGYCRLAADSTVIVRETDGVVAMVGTEDIKGCIINYLDNIRMDGIAFTQGKRSVKASKLALRDTYLRQHHLIINPGNLEHLSPLPKEILNDDAHTAYFPFKDGIVKVTANDIIVIDYRDLNGKCVWKGRVINRNHPLTSGQDGVASKFEDFLCNISCGEVSRVDGFRSAIGYLLHNYTRPSVAVAIILYDEELSDGATPNGGTGKGIIAKAVGEIRKVTRIDAKNYRCDDRFKFQLVNEETQIVWLDDPRPDFYFPDLYSAISEGLSFEAKNQPTRVFVPQRSPKFIITSNTILSSKGSSNGRRQRIFEVGSHYKDMAAKGITEPIEKEHGGLFFDSESWDEVEYARFDLFMLNCTRLYLDKGLPKSEPINVALNELIQRTSEEFAEWAMEQEFELNKKYNTAKCFLEFKTLHYGDDPQFKQRGFTEMLKKFAVSNRWKLLVKRSNRKSNFHFLSL